MDDVREGFATGYACAVLGSARAKSPRLFGVGLFVMVELSGVVVTAKHWGGRRDARRRGLSDLSSAESER